MYSMAMAPTTYNPLTIETKILHPSNFEYNPPALDLCVKKKRESPSYTLTYPSPRQSPVYEETSLPPEQYKIIPRTTSESSEESDNSQLPKNELKLPRPFKMFPKNPLDFTSRLDILANIVPLPGLQPLQEIDSGAMNYEEFRKKMLHHVQTDNSTNHNMRRYPNLDEKTTDPTYVEKRKKNNEAAKRSRDARKAREDEIAIRCAFLEQENLRLRAKIAAAEADLKRLANFIFRR